MIRAAANDSPDPHSAALRALMTITLAERRAFPGTVGEAIGLTYTGRDGTYVMTERGWERQ